MRRWLGKRERERATAAAAAYLLEQWRVFYHAKYSWI